MLVFILILFYIFNNCYCCLNTPNEYCQEVTYKFKRIFPEKESKRWKCSENKMLIKGITENKKYLISSNFHDFICENNYGIKCTERYLKKCSLSPINHIAHICYLKNPDYNNTTYRFILKMFQQSVIPVKELMSLLNRLNGTQQIIDMIDDEMFKQNHPIQRQEILDYYKNILNVDRYILSCLMGELYDLFSNIVYFSFKINSRLKTPFSYWSKFSKLHRKVDDILSYDIIVQTIDQCYEILLILKENYIITQIEDYIKQTKITGYQAIHITIHGINIYQYLEIHILTDEMHQKLYYDSLSHWIYKQQRYGDPLY